MVVVLLSRTLPRRRVDDYDDDIVAALFDCRYRGVHSAATACHSRNRSAAMLLMLVEGLVRASDDF